MLDVIYKGISFSSMGFYYIPTATQRGDTVSSFSVISDSYASRDGGIRYGSRVDVKKFELKFYYDYIAPSQKEQFVKLVYRNSVGELYFTERPYAKYTAFVSNKPSFEEYGHAAIIEGRRISGIVTIQMEAYNPFAMMTERYLDALVDSEYYHNIKDETSIIVIAEDPMPVAITASTNPGEFIYDLPTTQEVNNETSYITTWNLKMLYPGTEYGRLNLDIAGNVGTDGLTIYNGATTQTCNIIGLTDAVTSSVSRWYHVNSVNGQCKLTNGISYTLDYHYHDNGYISLAPADIIRDVEVKTTAGSTTIKSENGTFDANMVGKYIFLEGQWRAINTFVSPTELVVGTASTYTNHVMADVAKLNVITITGGADTALTKLRLYMQAYVR